MREQYDEQMVRDVTVQFQLAAKTLYLATRSLNENQRIESGLNYPKEADEILKAKNIYLENMFRAAIWTGTKVEADSLVAAHDSGVNSHIWVPLTEAFRTLAIRFDQWEEAKRAKEAGPEVPAEEVEES